MKEQNSSKTYKNVMELLVDEEINQQLQTLPPKLVKYINCVEVATYALNRLPTLYASSSEGLEKQRRRARKELKSQIVMATRQGIAAVQRDPIRKSTPLVSEKDIESEAAKEALQMLEGVLDSEELSWISLAELAKETLSKNKRLYQQFYGDN